LDGVARSAAVEDEAMKFAAVRDVLYQREFCILLIDQPRGLLQGVGP